MIRKHNTTNSNMFELTNKMKAIRKEILDMKSINGMKVAGKTSKLDNIYITLL